MYDSDLLVILFCFFKQKAAYEVRISDWSSDVCSSDLELDQAMDQIASGNFVLGEYHFILTLYADSQERLSRNIATARAELSNAGFVSAKEDLAVVSSFYSQFPGNWKYRTRLANVSSLNFLGLSPLHNFATGKKENNPWGDCVTTLQTTHCQPYYFKFH